MQVLTPLVCVAVISQVDFTRTTSAVSSQQPQANPNASAAGTSSSNAPPVEPSNEAAAAI